ncbi:helix-turn-helix domain-containing protein (plasmid) [Mycolicibacterium sp. ELW1]|uniref:helix-turn-helix domain-containing protein n=1 Tax=Mycobacteriaceae TaxID=1762 RepID=UPI0011F078D1|nr:helix-turn-helix transcriptional regulator [Mycobacterium sp. ELW1]QEN17524.1 helix-turn-helix transcriptional regulator [Mycobacterium sp. ELW1]
MTDALIRQAIKELKDVRTDRGLTIAQVAEAIGVDKGVISRFENETVDPHISTLLRYASAVGADIGISIEPRATTEWDTRILRDVGRRLRPKLPQGLTLDASKADQQAARKSQSKSANGILPTHYPV